MKVKVYLNEGPGRFINYEVTMAQLRLAAEFEIDPEFYFTLLKTPQGRIDAILGMIFEQLNVGGEFVTATEWTTKYRANRNRSLSVGDVVTLDETAWAVQSFGFRQISTEDLEGAINA